MLPGNLIVLPGSLIVLPGNLIVLLGNREHFSRESLHTGARARGHHGQPIARIQLKTHLLAAELRTYKINLLGKSIMLRVACKHESCSRAT